MSENSIDIDVNFNLNEISTLFAKVMEGLSQGKDMSNVFKEIDPNAPIGSLMSQGSLTEDKTKLYESLSNIDQLSPLIEILKKLQEELIIEEGDQGDIIERTERNMSNMLTISKLLLKMFETKFPISEDMGKDIDEMSKILSDQSLTFDNKLDKLMATMSNAFASFREDRQAFRTIPGDNAPTLGDLFGRDNTQEMSEDFRKKFKAIANVIRSMADRIVERGGTGSINISGTDMGEFSLADLERLAEYAEQGTTLFRSFTENLERSNQEISAIRSERSLREGEVARDVMGMPVIEKAIEKLTKLTGDVGVIFKRLEEHVKGFLTDATVDLEGSGKELNEVIITLNKSITVLEEAARLMVNAAQDIGNTTAEQLKIIAEKIDESLIIKTIEEVFDQIIANKLIAPINETSMAKRLEFALLTAKSVINTLAKDLQSFMIGKTPEELKELGLPGLKDTQRTVFRLQQAQREFGTTPEGNVYSLGGVQEAFDMSEINIMSGFLKDIASDITKKTGFVEDIDLHMRETNELMKNLVKQTKNINATTDTFDDKIGILQRTTNNAMNLMGASEKKIQDAGNKINEIIEEWGKLRIGFNLPPSKLDFAQS